MFPSSLVPYSRGWKCTVKALLNGLFAVRVKQIQERTCVAIVAKFVLKLIWVRRSYTKVSFLCAINVKHREKNLEEGVNTNCQSKQTEGPLCLKPLTNLSLRFYKIKVYIRKDLRLNFLSSPSRNC